MENELFEKTSVPKAYLKLALPVVMSMAISLVYNMVDTYFIALTGNTDLVAGISLAAPVFTLMIAFGDIWGLGGSSLISRLLGEKREELARKVSAFSFWAAIFWGIFVTVVMLLFRSQILQILGADQSTWKYASDYYTWIVAGATTIILSIVPGNILRTEGLVTQSMAGSILGSVINMILDPVFIFGLGLGAAGAAIATVIGNIASDVFFVFVIMKKSRCLSVALREIKIPGASILEILKIGIPASVTNIMQSFMIMMTNHFLLAYGTDKVAAMGIALKINMIAALILVGFAFGGQPLVGYNYGAKNKERLGQTVRFAYMLEGILALIFTSVMCAFAPVFIRFFMKDAQIVESGAMMLRCLQSSLIFMSVVLVSTCICQSFGKAKGAFILSFSRQGLIFAIVILIMSSAFGLMGVLLSQAVSDLITAGIALVIIVKYMKKIP